MTTSTFFLSILCSIIASFIFIFSVLIFFKPKLRLCDFMCRNNSQFPGDYTTHYFFKIVNVSWFSAYDIRVQLNILEKYPTPPSGMMNKRTIPLTLVSAQVSHLPPFRPMWWRKDAEHCIRFRTVDKLDDIIKDDYKSVQLQVTARHGLTGLVKVFYQDFADVSLIRDGKFTYGTKFGHFQ